MAIANFIQQIFDGLASVVPEPFSGVLGQFWQVIVGFLSSFGA